MTVSTGPSAPVDLDVLAARPGSPSASQSVTAISTV